MNPNSAPGSTIHLAFSPDPAYVRTVRLVAAAVAQRAGVGEELLDEVRLAIGEACTRAVAVHSRRGLTDLVDVTMTTGGRFTVRVTDRGSAELAQAEAGGGVDELVEQVAVASARVPVDEEALTAGVGLALLSGLVSDLAVEAADGVGTEVRMSWPVKHRS